MTGRGWTAVKAGVSLALIALLLTFIDLHQVRSILAAATPGWIGLGFVAALVAWAVNTWKWQGLLAGLGTKAPYRYLLALNFVGMFYSLVLPGQVSGEVLKGFRLARSGVGAAAAGLSILADRLTGLVALAAVGLCGLALAPRVPAGDGLAWFAAAVVGLGLTVLLAAFLGRAAGRNGWGPAAGGVTPTHRGPLGVLHRLLEGLRVYLRTPGTLARATLQAVLFQTLVTISNYFIARGVGVEIPVAALAWIVAAVSLLHLLPISVAGLGVREGAYALLLEQYGVPLPLGLSLSLAVFGVILAQGLVGGVVEFTWGSRARPELPLPGATPPRP